MHCICKYTYDLKVQCDKNLYHIDKENPIEEDIAFKILESGLNVPEPCIGLSSTVDFKGNVNSIYEDVFNYSYWSEDQLNNKVYVIVVAIPQKIYIKGREYFIGDLTNTVNIANFSMFRSLLPKEFIYGYYVKEYTSNNDNKNNCIFSDKLSFFENNCFYEFLDNKKEFWIKYLKNNKLRISLLDAANYPNIFNSVFQSCRNRWSIKNTKEQIKVLKK